MADNAVVREIQVKFAADVAKYRQQLANAGQATREVQERIDSVGEALKRANDLSNREISAMNQALAAASRQAAQMGKAATDLYSKSTQLTRAVTAEQNNLAKLKAAYQSTEKEIDRLKSAYDTIKSATEGLDLSTSLTEQREKAAAEMDKLEQEIQALHNGINSAGGAPAFFLPDNTLVSIGEAKKRMEQLIEETDRANERFQRLDEAIRTIGEENLGYASAKGLKQLQTDLGRSQQELERLAMQTQQSQSRLTDYSEKLAMVRDRQVEVSASTAELSERVEELKSVATPDIGQRIAQGFARAAEMVRGSLSRAFQMAGREVSRFAGKLISLAPGTSILKSVVDRLRGVKSGGDGANSALSGIVRQIRNINLAGMALRGVTLLFGRLRSVVQQYLSENAAAKNAVDGLKSAFANALAPAINVAINALSAILPYIQAVSNAFATLVTNLLGAEWTTISGAASSMGGVASATKDAAQAQKELNRELYSFDEINKQSDNSSGGSSGGSGGGGGGGTSTSTVTGNGMIGPLKEFFEETARLFKEGEWANLGTYLAESFGSAIDTAYNFLTSKEVYDKIDGAVNAFGTTVNSFFSRLTLIDDTTGGSIAEKTGQTIGAAINLAFYTVNSTLTSIDWGQIGLAIAQAINGTVKETDWGQIGETIANWFLTLPKILYSVIINTDWGAVAQGISDMIRSALQTVNDWLATVDWAEIGHAVADFLLGIDWAGIAGDIITFFVEAFTGLGTAIVTAIGDIAPSVAEAFSDLWEKIKKTFSSFVEFLGKVDWLAVLTGDTSSFKSAWSEFTVELDAVWKDGAEEVVDKYLGLDDKDPVTAHFDTDPSKSTIFGSSTPPSVPSNYRPKDALNSFQRNYEMFQEAVAAAKANRQSDSQTQTQTVQNREPYHDIVVDWFASGGAKQWWDGVGDWWDSQWKDATRKTQDVLNPSAVRAIPGSSTTKPLQGTVRPILPLNMEKNSADAIDRIKKATLEMRDQMQGKMGVNGDNAKTGVNAIKLNARLTAQGKDDVEKVYGLDGATMNTTVQDKLNEEPVSIFNRIRKTLDGVGVCINNSLAEEPTPMQKRIKSVLDGTQVTLDNKLQNTPAALSKGFVSGWKPGTLSHPNVLKTTPAALSKDFISKWKPGNLLFPTQTATTPASFASNTVKKVNDELSKAKEKVSVPITPSATKRLSASDLINKNTTVQLKYVTGTSKAARVTSNVGTLKFLAKGGIIKRPTWLDYDKIGGEAGAEAIVPLENNTAWLDKLADRLYQRMGGGNSGGIGQPMIVQVLMPDGRVLGETVVDYATGEAKRTGQLPWAAYE